MTYLSGEAAGEGPVELFRFSFGGFFWRYTSADSDFVATDGETYLSEPVLREGISINEEANTSSVTVSLPADNQVAKYFTRMAMPARHIWLTVSRTHRVEGADIAVIFTGVAASAKFEGGEAKITFVPLRDALNRQVPVQLVGTLCSNALYDSRCRADPEAHSNAVTVTDVDGLTLTVTGIGARATGYFSGGYIFSGGLYQYATVRDHLASDTLVLLFNPGYLAGDQVRVYAGCDKRLETCKGKFNNVPNFQGFPFFPLTDPFDDGVT